MSATIVDPNVAVWNTTAGSKTTASFNVVIGDLLVVVAASSGLAGGTTAVTDTGTGGTYTLVDSDRTGFSTTGVLNVFIRDGLVSADASITATAAQVGSTGGGLIPLIVRNMNLAGAAAVRSNGGQSTGGAGATPAPVLSQLPLALNPIIAAVANGSNGAAITPPTGYTEREPAGYNSPATGLEACWLESGENESTITFGATSATGFASVAIELNTQDVKSPAINFQDPAVLMKGALRRASGILVPKLWTPDNPEFAI